MINVQVISKATNEQLVGETKLSDIFLTEPSLIVIQNSIEAIHEVSRQKNNLIISFNNSEEITLEDFFGSEHKHDLMFKNENGQTNWATVTATDESGLKFILSDVTQETPIAIETATDYWPFIIGSGLVIGAGAILIASAGGHSDQQNASSASTNNAVAKSAIEWIDLLDQKDLLLSDLLINQDDFIKNMIIDQVDEGDKTDNKDIVSVDQSKLIESITDDHLIVIQMFDFQKSNINLAVESMFANYFS